jgi:hypothetical protein
MAPRLSPPRRGKELGRSGRGGDASGRVLLAYDGSKGASATAEVADEIANATGSEMHLFYVAASEPYPPPFDYV